MSQPRFMDTPLKGNPISPLTKNTPQHNQNLSLTNYSWDRTLFDGLQSRKQNTEEDQELYSYSKLSASNVNSGNKQDRSNENLEDKCYHLKGNYQLPESEYNPAKDYPQLLSSQPKTVSTTQNSKQKSQQEELQVTVQELSNRISQDQVVILRLQDTIQEKDKIIVKLQKFHRWMTEQSEPYNYQVTSARNESQQQQTRQMNKLKEQINELTKQVKIAEEQLRNSLRQQSGLEKENSSIKHDRLVFEQQYYQLTSKQAVLQQEYEQWLQETEELKEQIQELKKQNIQISKQTNLKMLTLTSEAKPSNLSLWDQKQIRKTSLETNHAYQSYRQNLEETHLRSLNHSDYDAIHVTKFVDCIVDMVWNCQPQPTNQRKPSLKTCWKWIKGILEEYMVLKKEGQLKYMKSSLKHKLSIHSHHSKTNQSQEHVK